MLNEKFQIGPPIFRSFCTPMYASQLWCDFRKSRMQRLRVAYNFGCRALYNLPWRAGVISHRVQSNIPTFEALLRKYTYLFLERCRKSSNTWFRALMQSDCLYSSLCFRRPPHECVIAATLGWISSIWRHVLTLSPDSTCINSFIISLCRNTRFERIGKHRLCHTGWRKLSPVKFFKYNPKKDKMFLRKNPLCNKRHEAAPLTFSL